MLFWLVPLVAVGLSASVLLAGQLGFLRGHPPASLGTQMNATGPQLAPPSLTPNSVSSQATRYPNHPQAAYAAIAPFTWAAPDTGAAALARLAALLQDTPGVTVVEQREGYVRAEAQTHWLKFVDDVELLLDEPAGVIQVRSASRLGRKDFGANRARVEALRQRFSAQPPPH